MGPKNLKVELEFSHSSQGGRCRKSPGVEHSHAKESLRLGAAYVADDLLSNYPGWHSAPMLGMQRCEKREIEADATQAADTLTFPDGTVPVLRSRSSEESTSESDTEYLLPAAACTPGGPVSRAMVSFVERSLKTMLNVEFK